VRKSNKQFSLLDDSAAPVIHAYFIALTLSCTVLLPLSVLRALDTGWLPLYTYHCIIYAVILGIALARCGPEIEIKVSIALFLAIASVGIAEFGFTALAEAALIVAMVFSVLGFGWRGLLLCAFASVAICLTPLFALWLSPVFDIGIRPYEVPHSSWLLGTMAILLFGTSAGFLVGQLNATLKKQAELLHGSQAEQENLIRTLTLETQRAASLTSAVEQLDEAVVVFSDDDRILMRNRAWVELNKDIESAAEPGVTFEEHLRAGVRAGVMIDGIGREDEWVAQRLEHHRNPKERIEVRRQDGRVIAVKEQVLENKQIVLTIQDITDVKQAQERSRLYEQVVMNAKEGIFITDAQGYITDVNETFERLVGLQAERIKGLRLRDVPGVATAQPQEWFDAQVREINELGSSSADFVINATPVWAVAYALYGEAREVINRAGFVRDMSERKKDEARLEQLAFTDSLTGLINVAHFQHLFAAEIQRHRRSERDMALLFLDLDDFKGINDSLGHAAGDQVLKDVAKCLKALVRETDIVARRGGDEFIVLLTQLSSSDSVEASCRKLIDGVAALYDSDSVSPIGLTIGIAIYPTDSKGPEQLQIYADRAMYVAKARGKNRFEAYSKRLQQRLDSRRNVEEALKHAIENAELELHFQPIVNLETQRVVAAEALLRWFRDGRYIPPMEFIPVAEDSDLILDIDLWVLDEACRELRKWSEYFPRPMRMHINLSSKFVQAGNIDAVAQALARHSLNGNAVCLEITETAVITDMSTARRNVMALQGLGLSVGLDDFGTGYSSLNHLVDFPIDLLKIDRKFVDRIGSDPASQVIVEAVSTMARRLGNDVVAEGVETETQRDFVYRLGCQFAQGYLFGKPTSASDFRTGLREI
jgi:diguanylate cyclase (GGDEF)-like protein/PAS domain S-box-containing protein